jgi:hypothetical protein
MARRQRFARVLRWSKQAKAQTEYKSTTCGKTNSAFQLFQKGRITKLGIGRVF